MALVCVFSSCTKKDIAPTCDQAVVVSNNEFNNAPNDEVVISEILITENCLNITFQASGCDGNNWDVKLIDKGEIAESLPPQRTLRLSLNNPEDCLAFITKTLSFDITTLQVDTEEVILNIDNEDGFLYTY